jgi:hypothetical protein
MVAQCPTIDRERVYRLKKRTLTEEKTNTETVCIIRSESVRCGCLGNASSGQNTLSTIRNVWGILKLGIVINLENVQILLR